METFTLEQFKAYLLKQDSLGDAVYNLRPENIKEAEKKPDRYIEPDDILYTLEEFKAAESEGSLVFHDGDAYYVIDEVIITNIDAFSESAPEEATHVVFYAK